MLGWASFGFVDVRGLVESELARRGLSFAVDLRSRRLIVSTVEGTRLLSLDNLERMYAMNPSATSVSGFLDALLAPATPVSYDGLFWLLEPNTYDEHAEFTASVSRRLERVLAHVASDGSRLMWLRQSDLDALGADPAAASVRAYSNLDRELQHAKVVTDDSGGVRVLFLNTSFPSKASLLLAPTLRESVAPHLGWPVLAVAPDRDFVLLWNATHDDFIGRVGAVAAREHNRAPYPLSVEVLRIDDDLQAIGEFTSDEHE